MTKQPRKFHIRSYNHFHTVFEVMPGHGERAVSPAYASKEHATQALAILQTTNIARVLRGELER